MRKITRALALLLCMSMALGQTAFAAGVNTSGGDGTVPVELTAEATTFKVRVPTILPVDVDADGVVTVADDARLVNESAGPVRVSNVAVTNENGWELQDWDSFVPEKAKVDAKQYAMVIRDDKSDGSDNGLAFDPNHWPVMTAAGTSGAAVDVIYDSKVAPQSSILTDMTMGLAVFTLGWEEAPAKAGVPIPSTDSSFTWELGERHTPSVPGYDPEVMEQSGDTSAVNAGTYEITYSLKDPDSYQWEDGTTEPKTLTWKVDKKTSGLTASLSKDTIWTLYNDPPQGVSVRTNSDGPVIVRGSNFEDCNSFDELSTGEIRSGERVHWHFWYVSVNGRAITIEPDGTNAYTTSPFYLYVFVGNSNNCGTEVFAGKLGVDAS